VQLDPLLPDRAARVPGYDVKRSENGCLCGFAAAAPVLFFTVFNTAVLYIAGCGKLRGSDSNGENAEWLGGKPVKKEKKRPRLSFGKKKILLHFSPKPSMENAGKYITYKNQSPHLWKTRWKKWKTPWETTPLFHKFGGKHRGKGG
jgi:hypothetical protein